MQVACHSRTVRLVSMGDQMNHAADRLVAAVRATGDDRV